MGKSSSELRTVGTPERRVRPERLEQAENGGG